MTELLLHTGLTEQQRRFAEAAHNSGESLLDLINAILDFSKIEAEKVELEQIDFCPVELVDEICYLQGEPSQRKGLSLVSVCDQSVPARVEGDPTRIRQVIMNLVSNAIKFTHTGSITVSVSATAKSENGRQVTLSISVHDTGIGMNSETQSRVFDAFTQADTSTTRQYGGTGLGLAISKQYVEMMNGNITVSSTPGQGTNITVSLPLPVVNNFAMTKKGLKGLKATLLCDDKGTIDMVSSHLDRLGTETFVTTSPKELPKPQDRNEFLIIDYDFVNNDSVCLEAISKIESNNVLVLCPLKITKNVELLSRWKSITKPITLSSLYDACINFVDYKKPSSPDHDQYKSQNTERKLKILVAEDVEMNQKIAEEMLQLLDFDVDIAKNGEAAVEQFQKGSHILIFMDCQMPVMDGFEATRQIRQIENLKGLAPIPIIALTAGISKDDKNRCIEAGMDSYLTKPFSISELSDSIREFEDRVEYFEADERNNESQEYRDAEEFDIAKTALTEVFNLRAINNIREVEIQTGKPILKNILEGYNDQMRSKLSEISENSKNSDSVNLYRTAHAIKSMSANIGAEKVRSISARIEEKSRLGDLSDIDKSIGLLTDAFQEFLRDFETRFINQLK